MSADELLSQLERRFRETGDPADELRYLRALARAGRGPYTSDQVSRLGRVLEIRRLQRQNSSSVRRLLQQLFATRRAGYRGAVPPQFNDLSRTQYRAIAAQLARRGSPVRTELAQFIRHLRTNPSGAAYVRHIVQSGGASGSLAFVGGQISGRSALMRAAFGTAARAVGAFVLTPQGIVVVTAIVLAAGIAWYLTRPRPAERQIAGINCDCANINAGLLNVGFIPECRLVEEQLIADFRSGEFELKTEGGIIVGGSVCEFAGPAAWPLVGAPAEPPMVRPRDTESCREFVGLTRECADR